MLRAFAVFPFAFALLAQTPGLRIVVVEGQGALNDIRGRTAHAPIVRVVDESERPVEGAIVNFTLPSMGAGGFFEGGQTTSSVITGADGIAKTRGLRPNNMAGQFTIRVSASHDGQSATAAIEQTNVAPAARSSSKLKWVLLAAAAGGAGAVVAATRGGSGTTSTSPPAAAGGVVITPGPPVVGPPH